MKAIKRYDAATAKKRECINKLQRKYLQKKFMQGKTQQQLEELFAHDLRKITQKNWALFNRAHAHFRKALLRGGRPEPLSVFWVRAYGSAYGS